MRTLKIFSIAFFSFATLSYSATTGLQASNLLNPNISVIGWLQAETGHRYTPPEAEASDAAAIKEMEIAFQAVVDPYSRADIFLAVENGEIDLEEGYLTWFALPGQIGLKAGKFRANLGKFNRVHTPETAFADRPLVHERYFGEEGFSGTGGSLSWQVPTSRLFLNVDAEIITTPETEDVPTFGKAKKNELTYVGRVSGYTDINETANVTTGVSFSQGPAGEEFDAVANSSTTLKNNIFGLDTTFRWKNPRRAVYRSLYWQTELFLNRHENSTTQTVNSKGLFSHLEFQFAKRWRTGARYDYAESPTDKTDEQKGGLLYLTFYPSEFSLISLQGRHVIYNDGLKEDLGFLKVTFNIGPHGSHPF